MLASGVRGGLRGEEGPSKDVLDSEPSRGSRERELDADEEEILEDELVLRDLGRLGPAWCDSGIEGSSDGEPGRESSRGGKMGVAIEILRE